MGIHLGQLTFWMIVAFIINHCLKLRARNVLLVLILIGLIIKIFGAWAFSNIVDSKVWWVFMSVPFVFVGASIYGRNSNLIKKQLTVYFLLCIPIMISQIMGLGWIFMTWNTEFAHDLSVLAYDEIGTFKKIPVYPTLFIEANDLTFSIGQGRPPGLCYSNNVLSVLIGIYSAIILTHRKNFRISYSDIILVMVTTLSGSLTSLGIIIILILLLAVYGGKPWRFFLTKFTILLGTSYIIYSILFPGIFDTVFSYVSIWDSILWRVMDFASIVGYTEWFNVLFSEQLSTIGVDYKVTKDSSFSGITLILKSRHLILIGVLFLFMAYLFWKKFKLYQYLNNNSGMVYTFTLVACLLTQLGIPYFSAPIFQIFIGYSFYPVLNSYKNFHRKKYNFIYFDKPSY